MERCPSPSPLSLLAATVATWLLVASAARAELYVTVMNGTTVRSYETFNGAVRSANFISGLSNTQGVFVSGNQLYVVRGSTVDRFDARTGAATGPGLISGLSFATTGAASGGNLYVANQGADRIVKFGTVANPNFVVVSNPSFLAISGADLYVTNSLGKISRYTTSGVLVAEDFITGLNNPAGLAVSGGRLYVAMSASGQIRAYDARTGALLNADFITGVPGPLSIAIHKGRLYVANTGNGTVGVYNVISGAPINPALITGVGGIYGIAIRKLTPTVTLPGPSGIRVRSATRLLRGRSTDAATVRVRVGSGGFRRARGTKTWIFRVRLRPGPNRILVQAVSSDGDLSRPDRVNIVRKRR